MTIDEAIEVLTDPKNMEQTPINDDFEYAYMLGIEALKKVKQIRDNDPRYPWIRLAGETEEDEVKP